MRSPDELTNLFRERRLKVTPQRMAVFEAIHGDAGHPTAEVVWARVRQDMPNVSLRTVYQALNDLVDMNEIKLVSVGNGASRFDPNITAHHHFVCRGCERVFDVDASRPRMVAAGHPEPQAPTPTIISPTSTAPRGSAGHTVEGAEIIFRGLCASCATPEQSHANTTTLDVIKEKHE